MAAALKDGRSEHHDSYLILHNIAKRSNYGFLLRTATAFGVAGIIVVGKRRFDAGGACGTARGSSKRHFHTMPEACAFLRSRDCSIVGIEITDSAQPVHCHRWSGSTAFMVGNEGGGLTASQKAHCDAFVYIAQYGSVECLNVNVAAGITLHHFAVWAGLYEQKKCGGRFVPDRQCHNGQKLTAG